MLRSGLLVVVALGATLALAVATSASASGPAAPGKQILTVDCVGFGPVTVSVQRADNSNGAAQIVGQHGHAIPVSFTETVVDLDTAQTLITNTDAIGGGHAHPNQQTTTCSLLVFEGPASEFFLAE